MSTPPKLRLLSLTPWAANGPGWSNMGIDLIWQDNEGRQTKETILQKDLSAHALILFPFYFAMHGEMSKLAERRELKANASSKRKRVS